MQTTPSNNESANPPREPDQDISDEVMESDQQEKDGRSARKVFKAFVVSSIILFCLLYALFLGTLINGQLSNPLFETLGLEPSGIKQTLLLVTNSLFGLLSLSLLVAMLVKFFQWIMTKSKDIRKASRLQKSSVFFGILIGIVTIWIGLFWLITRASVVQTRSAENSLIITNPETLIGLTSPQVVEFDVGTKLFKQVDPENIRQIDWDFNGDGKYDASGPSVQYEFIDKGENNGRYLVSVEVRYYSEDSKSEKVYIDNREVIIANEAVIADLKASPLVGQAPLAVTLSADKSRDPDGEIMMYEWDLDGDNSYEIRGREKSFVDKVFTTLGEHTVRLRVTGRNNDFNTTETIIAVKPPDEKIRAQITSKDSAFEGLAPLKIEFDGAQSFVKKGRITKYEWQVEGEPASILGRKIKRTFDRAGEYTVTLTVENEEGERDQAEQVINVFEKKEIIVKSSPKMPEDGILVGNIPFEVILDSSESEIPRAIEWQWDYQNDGIPDEFAPRVSKTFRVPGEYEVRLTIVDSDKEKYEKIIPIKVMPPSLLAKITANPNSGAAPIVVSFDGSSSNSGDEKIINYIWEFPKTEPIHSGAKISRKFETPGTYPIKLTVITDTGKKNTVESFVSVREAGLVAKFNISPNSGAAPLAVQFDPNQSNGKIIEYEWDFDDGTTSKKVKPTHIFRTPGEYFITLRITDRRGIVTETKKILVVSE